MVASVCTRDTYFCVSELFIDIHTQIRYQVLVIGEAVLLSNSLSEIGHLKFWAFHLCIDLVKIWLAMTCLKANVCLCAKARILAIEEFNAFQRQFMISFSSLHGLWAQSRRLDRLEQPPACHAVVTFKYNHGLVHTLGKTVPLSKHEA